MPMAAMKRRQLTLFVPDAWAASLERVRSVLDPVQHGLIAAHVTLCREDELAGVDASSLDERLPGAGALTLGFGPAQRFAGHGVLRPCIAGTGAFEALRQRALGRADLRTAQAHLTLAHPRNPRAPGNVDARLAESAAPLQLRFDEVAWIEQDGDAPWAVLRRWAL